MKYFNSSNSENNNIVITNVVNSSSGENHVNLRFFKLSYQILLFEIPKYLELNDYLNYISTCKFLKNNYKHSSIWKRLLNKGYSEEEILFAQNENSSYDKYKKLVTQTLSYDKCEIAHGNTHWRKNKDELYLIGVWWFQILGKFKYVPDGYYIPEFKVKFSKRRMGLDHLRFKTKVIEIEPIEKEKDDTKGKEQEQSTQSSSSSNSNSIEKEKDDTKGKEQELSTPSNSSLNSVPPTIELNYHDNINQGPFICRFRSGRLRFNRLRYSDFKVKRPEPKKDNNNNNNNNNENDNNNQPSVNERVIMKTKYQIDRDTVNLYANDDDQWCIIEGGEIKVDRSHIDPKRTKVAVHLEIRDVDGYYKEGFSFKGMLIYIRKKNVFYSHNTI
ncbi:hypothetical protein LY90DRAFT_677165 [Neocallimastix californiae]|uniref:F-box domain-containing protein n=1 Tax=Neocallimastix californiae TaxID=1754190 RepID=A0A1Y2A8M9_9FUNG|nr:hypothetical protein LY90DRAFT_677165 [Neocallimastix californiae]|eukprot:ORY18883.1 hypothetical protein LY90DRAFT_677165 [Neocallimastix californiae]